MHRDIFCLLKKGWQRRDTNHYMWAENKSSKSQGLGTWKSIFILYLPAKVFHLLFFNFLSNNLKIGNVTLATKYTAFLFINFMKGVKTPVGVLLAMKVFMKLPEVSVMARTSVSKLN